MPMHAETATADEAPKGVLQGYSRGTAYFQAGAKALCRSAVQESATPGCAALRCAVLS